MSVWSRMAEALWQLLSAWHFGRCITLYMTWQLLSLIHDATVSCSERLAGTNTKTVMLGLRAQPSGAASSYTQSSQIIFHSFPSPSLHSPKSQRNDETKATFWCNIQFFVLNLDPRGRLVQADKLEQRPESRSVGTRSSLTLAVVGIKNNRSCLDRLHQTKQPALR